MKLLITGHLGYIGVEMVSVLTERGHDVVGLDTGFYEGCDFAARPDDVPSLRVDLRDITPAHVEGYDAVLHLAALSNDPLGDIDPTLTYRINLDASVRLAEAAKAAGVERFVFASSCSLYGAGGDDLVTETAAFHPVTPYGESKVKVEQALVRLADDDFSPVFLRNATAYGVSRRLRADVVVNNLVGHAVTTGKVLLQSDGTPWRPLVHIRDIIAAFEACLTAPREQIHAEAFNVGRSGENYQIRTVAEMVADVVPGCEVTFAPGASSDRRDYRVDFSKIESSLTGYRSEWTLRDGIVELYDAYTASGLDAAEWTSSRYYRLKTIQDHLAAGRLDDALRWSD
ncbi:MAG: SDR family oxidoreductase [Acidimicrobiia bacterium]|nr:SDR family oxidoreductase [Acidimicrobiia bacterium]